MSYNNFDYNNQTPPTGDSRPDYSYNWNGSEHNNNNKGGGWKTLIAIAVIVGVLAVAVFGIFMAQQNSGDASSDVSNSSDISDMSADNNSKPPKDPHDYSRDPNASIPDFKPAPDIDADLSTMLSGIYEECAPACCTISVSLKGRPYSIGSGFVIDAENGFVATNHHVIEEGDEINVVFYDGTEYPAQIVGSDSTTDLAVLHIEGEDLPQVSFGDSSKVLIGENVVAIGTPFDMTLAGTMTCGIISGIARDIDITNSSGKVIKTMTLLQTDCSINPGNSGGPLIDMAGNVIGITSMKLVDEQYEGIGFAIPITSAIDIFQKLISGEDIGDSDIAVATPQIGITVYDVEDGLEYFRMRPYCEYPEGVLIADIDMHSSAYRAGLSRYDIITDFNGVKVTNREELTNALSNYRAGDKVVVTVFRFNRMLTAGESYTVEFKLDAAS
ncbi:MAG: trypsin-like peptidase domain-containing protein [Clostridia bacterium]|nr:trypsin-like peptidase domain-containing protein [Clostridia bacterium]